MNATQPATVAVSANATATATASANATAPASDTVSANAADFTAPEQPLLTTGTETPREMAPPVSFSWGGYFEAIGVMFLLLGCLWAALWLVRKYARFRFIPQPGAFPRNGLRVETQLPLGPRKGLFVVQYLNRRLLLGVTEQQITLLESTPYTGPDECENRKNESVSEHDAKTFAQLLAEEGAPDHDPKPKA